MFTGVVQTKCAVVEKKQIKNMYRMVLDLKGWSDHLHRGASVSVNGVCLTVVEIKDHEISFDIIPETIQRTNLEALRTGEKVNIERAYKAGDEIGGHHVTGHIDTTATIQNLTRNEHDVRVQIQCDPNWIRYVIPKGWIAIDGISLTVVEVSSDWFSVHLIPETLSVTTLGSKNIDDLVNLEFDHQTKVIVHTLERILPAYLSSSAKANYEKI